MVGIAKDGEAHSDCVCVCYYVYTTHASYSMYVLKFVITTMWYR